MPSLTWVQLHFRDIKILSDNSLVLDVPETDGPSRSLVYVYREGCAPCRVGSELMASLHGQFKGLIYGLDESDPHASRHVAEMNILVVPALFVVDHQIGNLMTRIPYPISVEDLLGHLDDSAPEGR